MSNAKRSFESALDFNPDSDSWPEPKPLMRLAPPPEPFPVDTLGHTLAAAAKKAHEVIQAPMAICGMSFLAAANLAVQAHADIEIDGRKSPVSLWIMSIAESGQRKSAVDSVALRMHRAWEREQIRAYREEKQKYERAREVHKSNKKASKGKGEHIDEPDAPLRPLLTLSEPTYEGLAKQLAEGLPTIGLFTDEGARFLGGHAMNQDNQYKTAGGFNSLWDRGEVDRCRSGDGTDRWYGKRAALHLMIQPRASSLLFSNRDLDDQGFIARFLVTHPQPISGRQYQSANLEEADELKYYYAAIDKVLRLPLPIMEGTANELEPRVIRLTEEAHVRYSEFHDELQTLVAPGERLYEVRSLAHKAHDHAARIAATLTLFDNPYSTQIDERYMENGIEIATYCVIELRRLIGAPAVDQTLLDAQELLDWMTRRARPVCSAEIQQRGPNRLRTASKVKEALFILIQHGWIRPSKVRVSYDSHERDAFEVRPDYKICQNELNIGNRPAGIALATH